MENEATPVDEAPVLGEHEFAIPAAVVARMGLKHEDLLMVSKRGGQFVASHLKAGSPEMLVHLDALTRDYESALKALNGEA